MRNILITISIIATSAACTPAAKAPMMSLGASPVLDGGTYSTGGGITIAAEIKPLGGMTALCGVWAESKRQSVLTKGAATRVLHTGSAYLGGEVLHRDLAFMSKVVPAENYAGQQASCVQTSRPWSASQPREVQLRLPQQVVHRQVNDNDGASIAVTFRQTGPGTSNPSLKSLILGE